jgi:multicomponent Na+:H+ antiporter subunit C
MNLVIAVAVAVIIGSGSYLLLKHDLVRVAIGMMLVSHGASLFVMLAGLMRGVAPIYPIGDTRRVADPLVQAMTLTAIVITFGVTALLLSLIYRVSLAHATLDTDELALVEEMEERQAELDSGADDPEDDEMVLVHEGQAS